VATQKIHFFEEGTFKGIRFSKTLFRDIANRIFTDHSKELLFLNIIFCDDDYLLEINRTHLNHDYYTDIITFDYTMTHIESDIYISIDRVRDNAAIQGVPVREELFRVMIHGCIHLCGFGDKTPEEISKMRAKENEYLSLYYKS